MKNICWLVLVLFLSACEIDTVPPDSPPNESTDFVVLGKEPPQPNAPRPIVVETTSTVYTQGPQPETFVGRNKNDLTQCLGEPSRAANMGSQQYLTYPGENCEATYVVQEGAIMQTLHTTNKGRPMTGACPVLNGRCRG